MLCVSLAHSLAVLWLALNENLSVLDSLPPFMQKLTLLGDNGVLPALVVVTCGFLVTRFSSRGVTRGFAILTMVAVIAAFAPFTRTWTVEQYDAVLVDSFSNWRARIPAGSEVLWVDSELETAATNTWLLLQRPSYMSITQAPNALFSREAALKMAQRSKTLSGLMPFADPFSSGVASNGERVSELKALCQALSVRYIVTSETFSDAIPIPAPHTARSPLRDNNLYSCT